MLTTRRRDKSNAVSRCVAFVLRALALLLALQVSEVAHSVGDVVLSALAPAAFHDSDCGNDPDKCPPGCPNCHCSARTNVAAPESFDPMALLALPIESQLAPALPQQFAYDSAWHLAIYRPPRSVAG